MRNATGLKVRTIAILSTLTVAILLLTSLFPLVYAAVPWTKDPGEVSLKEESLDELLVIDSWVIKNDTNDYEMRYTHSRADKTVTELATSITNILSDNLITDLVSPDLDGLLDDLAAIADTPEKMNALWNFIASTTTIIGYATSTDGTNWTVQNDQVLAGADDDWDNVGTPCVIKDGSVYKMWFTHSEIDLDKSRLAGYPG